MTSIREAIRKPTIQIIVLFLLFHIFWLAFYFLSDAAFLKNGLWHIYVKYFAINTLGFIAFCISGYLLFPIFISRKKYLLLLTCSLVIIVVFGYLQFLLQDWDPRPFFSKRTVVDNATSGSMPMVKMQQLSGAHIRAMLNMLVYILLGTGYGYMKDWFIKDRRTQILEKEKTKAELTLLRYQLNPHFLFNTINDIYYLAIIKSEKTADAILKVSELLRYVLDHKADTVLLEKELDHLEKFLLLQQFRFPDQIVEVDISIKDKIGEYEIAPLLLTTFAENAFKHGEPGTKDVPVKISISVEDKVLSYSVVNKINRQEGKDATTGIGLNNLKKRLFLLYEGRYNLCVKEENDYFYADLQLRLL